MPNTNLIETDMYSHIELIFEWNEYRAGNIALGIKPLTKGCNTFEGKPISIIHEYVYPEGMIQHICAERPRLIRNVFEFFEWFIVIPSKDTPLWNVLVLSRADDRGCMPYKSPLHWNKLLRNYMLIPQSVRTAVCNEIAVPWLGIERNGWYPELRGTFCPELESICLRNASYYEYEQPGGLAILRLRVAGRKVYSVPRSKFPAGIPDSIKHDVVWDRFHEYSKVKSFADGVHLFSTKRYRQWGEVSEEKEPYWEEFIVVRE